MPIYDYSCAACGHSFDILQKLGDEPLTVCPECGDAALRKLLSAPAFHLKGKGWRNSDDGPKKPDTRPKFAHTFDSPVPHADHGHAHHSHDHGDHSHGHSHSHDSGGHGHSHSHGGGHKHDH